ncbi:MAG: glycosyl transferase family 36, partial [Dokdonella sp.]
MSRTFPYQTAIPRTHVLSNGDYSVMLTAAGSGYSQWRGSAITRWREDVTCDGWGSYFVLRDLDTGARCSAGFQPLAITPDEYSADFGPGFARIMRRDADLTTTLEVIVSHSDGEVRRLTMKNAGDREMRIEVTSYAEVVLSAAASDASHPAFSKIFVQTEYVDEQQVLIATRRPRSPREQPICLAQWLTIDGDAKSDGVLQYETDRARFIGRGRTLRTAAAINGSEPLSGTVGTVLDPIFSLRRVVLIAPGSSVSVLLTTAVGELREEVLELAMKRQSNPDFDRLRVAAEKQEATAQAEEDIDDEQARRFQRLATCLLYSDSGQRPAAKVITAGKGGGPTLWAGGISGDNPIMLVEVDDSDGLDLVAELFAAQSFLQRMGLTTDVVVLTTQGSDSMQKNLQQRVSRQNTQGDGDKDHAFFIQARKASDELQAGLRTAARIVLDSSRGSLADQVRELPTVAQREVAVSVTSCGDPEITPERLEPELERFNGYGGFDKDGREFVTIIRDGV